MEKRINKKTIIYMINTSLFEKEIKNKINEYVHTHIQA